MTRSAAALFVAAGAMFLLYPALRPYSDETGMAGAQAFASTQWLVAHVFAMFGFVSVALGVVALGSRLAWATMVAGAGLVLPYYGAETFALHAIGIRALAEGDSSVMSLADPIRNGAVQTVMFAAGLLLLAVGAVAMAARFGRLGVPFAAGFVLFLPQFYGTPAMRIAHGALMLVGCGALAYAVHRREKVQLAN